MKAVLRRRLEMAVRVRDFLRAHRTDGAEAAALTPLEELLGRAEAFVAQQRAGVLAERGAAQQRIRVRVALQRKLLRYLAGAGAVAAREPLRVTSILGGWTFSFNLSLAGEGGRGARPGFGVSSPCGAPGYDVHHE